MVSPSPLFYENETDPGTVDFKFEVEMEEKVDLATEDSPCSAMSGIPYNSFFHQAEASRHSQLMVKPLIRRQGSVGYATEHTFATINRRRPFPL